MAEKPKLGSLTLWLWGGFAVMWRRDIWWIFITYQATMQYNLQRYSLNILNREHSKSGVVFWTVAPSLV